MMKTYYSQLGQDKWILEKTNHKCNGFFIDIGAYDGITISNTYLLEKQYQWNGICVEPSSIFSKLKLNRNCILENLCVYSVSNTTVEFYETFNNLELSGIKNLFKEDEHNKTRSNNFKTINTKTISLTDLCLKHNCPRQIDYLSIDTEGSELEILMSHDFNRYEFKYITIEHNKNQDYKEAISNFLVSKNYDLDKSEQFLAIKNSSDRNFEDWYCLRN